MKEQITIFGAWLVVFPLHLLMTLFVVSIQLLVKIFHMPFDIWSNLKQDLKEMKKSRQ